MDVLQKARLLIWRHRERAESFAIDRMWGAANRGELRRAESWFEIVEAIELVKEVPVSAA